ncbi:antibiotic biosynthesis monooxygenase [Halioxenophilus aromaticivorans]|uniref:Antibiotic biosynthesis monooxygenase n=1 Tax=Halioxenophilus aromaticivorans TaxID=1306992 RepID=A0AAV3U4R0_9ALTE
MTDTNTAQGATVVIHQAVDHEHQPLLEQWITEIDPIIRRQPGFLDKQIIRPVPGLTHSYTIIIRFAERADLEHWLASPERNEMVAKIEPLLHEELAVSVHTGLEFLFQPPGASKTPVRWKQFLLTWSAIFPLVLLSQALVMPLLATVGLADARVLGVFCATGLVVYAMVYWVMPRYTKLVSAWLFK